MNEKQALKSAVQIVGTQEKLAKILGVTQSQISRWIRVVGRCRADCAIKIERATASAVTRHQLRPDLYPLTDRGRRKKDATAKKKSKKGNPK